MKGIAGVGRCIYRTSDCVQEVLESDPEIYFSSRNDGGDMMMIYQVEMTVLIEKNYWRMWKLSESGWF